MTISGKTSEKRYALVLGGCQRLWQSPVKHSLGASAPTVGQPLGTVFSEDYDTDREEKRAPSGAQATVKSERGSFKNTELQLDSAARLPAGR